MAKIGATIVILKNSGMVIPMISPLIHQSSPYKNCIMADDSGLPPVVCWSMLSNWLSGVWGRLVAFAKFCGMMHNNQLTRLLKL